MKIYIIHNTFGYIVYLHVCVCMCMCKQETLMDNLENESSYTFEFVKKINT